VEVSEGFIIKVLSSKVKRRVKCRSLLEYARNAQKQKVIEVRVNDAIIKVSIDVVNSTVREYHLYDNCCEVVNSLDAAYLLGSYYSGRAAKVYLKFYDDKNNKVYIWYDKTGHLPYFITSVPPEQVGEIEKIKNDSSFVRVEAVRKYDLLTGKWIRLSKIVVKDPQAVPRLRKLVPKAWEAKIKYHDNYMFDNGLIPGMMYSIKNGKFYSIEAKVPDAIIKLFEEAMKDADKELKETAGRLIPLFETRPPQIKRIALDIEVYTPFRGRIPDVEKAQYPIISVALVSNDGLKKVLVLARDDVPFGNIEQLPEGFEVEIFDSEKAMILEVFRIINQYPLIITFNGDGFDLPYLHNRALVLGIDPDAIPIENVRDFVGIRHGFHIDLYKFFSIEAIQNYAFGGAYKDKTLDAIAQALLGETKVRVEESISDLTIAELANYNARDADLTMKLTTFSNDLVWKLIILIMRLAKMSLEDVTRRKVSAWIKNLMYWEHRRRGYLIPNEEDLRQIKGVVKTAAKVGGKRYAGAIVIDPIPGVYFNVVVLDFASLYPSIIKVWNLSYETIDPPKGWCDEKDLIEVKDEKGEILHTVCKSKRGITSELVGLLRDIRVRVYKKMAKDSSIPEELRSWYDVVQSAMKVYINASYGVFGHEKFPLYTPSLAESVTALGRYVITSTLAKASELGLKVLYGDTDSLFIWNPQEEALRKLIKWVEESFALDLEVDKVYRHVAFALKKNYLGIRENGKIDVKGLVGKKKNVPKLVQETFTKVVELISNIDGTPVSLERVKKELKDTVQNLYYRLKNRDFTLEDVAFRTTLNKPIEEYRKTTPIHVKAAKQLKRYGIMVGKGDTILYVKTKTKDKVKAIQLAKLDDIDINEYIEAMKSVLQQLLLPFSIEWEEIAGSIGLYNFIARKR